MLQICKTSLLPFFDLSARKFFYQKRYLVLVACSLLTLGALRQLPPVIYDFIGLLDLHVHILNMSTYLIAMLLISDSLRSDIKSGALTLLLISPLSRSRYLLCKYIADTIIACMLYSLLFIVGWFAGLLPNASTSLIGQNFCQFLIVMLYQIAILYGCNLYMGKLWSFIIGCLTYLFISLLTAPSGAIFGSVQNFIYYVLYWSTPHYSEIKGILNSSVSNNEYEKIFSTSMHYVCTVYAVITIVFKKFNRMNL